MRHQLTDSAGWSGDSEGQSGAKRQVAERYVPPGRNILTTFSYGFQMLLISKVWPSLLPSLVA